MQELAEMLSKDMSQIRQEEERKWIDSLKNADNRVHDLTVTIQLKFFQEENRAYRREIKVVADKEMHIEKQIIARDQEIMRLKNDQEKNGVGLDGVKNEYAKKT